MGNQSHPEKHTITQSIILHLLPGILMGGFYFLVRSPLRALGFPSLFALMSAIIFVLLPVELGYLLNKGKEKTGRFTLEGVISYRTSISFRQYLLWMPVVFVAVGIIFAVLKPTESILRESVFFWVPALDGGLDGSYSKTALIITYGTMMIFGVIVGPLVEELYFRGYLLPRVPGKYAALSHSILFAAYHTFTPWMLITRSIGLLPLVWAVKRKSIYIGIAVHILVNLIDVIMGFVFIARMT